MKFFKPIWGVIALFFFFLAPSFAQGAANNFGWMQKDILQIKEIPVTVSPSTDKLILSDSPELVKRDGIMYQDTVEGDVRLFFHHVNDTDVPKKIVVLLINEGEKEAKITLTHSGLGGPGLDYLAIGKFAQNDYFSKKHPSEFTISPKRNALLDLNLNFIPVEPGQLVNGIYDFSSTAPIKVAVIMAPVDVEPMDAYNDSQILPTDKERLRGTFYGRDRLIVPQDVYDKTETGLRTLTLADNKIDTFSYGIDATDGTRTQNYGNYGVMYRLYFPSHSDSKFSLFLNPRGGVYAGSVNVKYQQKEDNILQTPAGIVFYGQTSNDFTHLGNYEGGHSFWMTFSPPGASNLPVKIIISPEHYGK
ncbi:MAG: copper amine oxidase [Sporomusaceae bacterium]|jgi:hypothetical protein|nr:copper amine oxidase [Sporomusaceae bacterium]